MTYFFLFKVTIHLYVEGYNRKNNLLYYCLIRLVLKHDPLQTLGRDMRGVRLHNDRGIIFGGQTLGSVSTCNVSTQMLV